MKRSVVIQRHKICGATGTSNFLFHQNNRVLDNSPCTFRTCCAHEQKKVLGRMGRWRPHERLVADKTGEENWSRLQLLWEVLLLVWGGIC